MFTVAHKNITRKYKVRLYFTGAQNGEDKEVIIGNI